jgi:putative transposase
MVFTRLKSFTGEGPGRGLEQIELENLDWVDWYNNRRIMAPLGDIPPERFESMYHEQVEGSAVAAGLN